MRSLRLAQAACLLAVPLLAGCAEPEQVGQPTTYMLSGSFVEGATPAQLEDFELTVRSFDGEPLIVDTEPRQFQARGMDGSRCRDLGLKLETLDYVAEVAECAEQTEAGEPSPGIVTSPEASQAARRASPAA